MSLFADAADVAAERIPYLPSEVGAALGKFSDQGGLIGLGECLLIAALSVCLGLLGELIVIRSLRHLRAKMLRAEGFRPHTRLAVAALRLSLSLISLSVFALIVMLVAGLLTEENPSNRAVAINIVLATIFIRAVSSISHFMFAPQMIALRIFKIPDKGAHLLHLSILGLGGASVLGVLASRLLLQLGLPIDFYVICLAFTGVSVFAGSIILVWHYKTAVAKYLEGETGDANEHQLPVKHYFAHSWHILATFYLTISGVIWAANTVLGRFPEAMAVLYGILIVMMLPLVDRLGHAFVSWIVSHHVKVEDADSAQRVDRFTRAFQGGLRILTGAAAILMLAEAWGAKVSDALATETGRAMLGSLIEIAVILSLALIGWDLFKHFLAQWFPEDEEGPAQPGEGEGGGAGATRAQTLVPLVRSFVLIVLVVMVTMVALDAAGVNIGPLLAGAGVVGLAVGFGAQKLVQDVLSGMFFLIDDAFRKGEYIETNDLRGTIEKISFRSMQLRHHRGPLQTIPFSEIHYVRNHSRDWVIMKLEFRVPYETDIERLRKTIKKLGLELLEDEILGPSFLEPLKSQGVLRMEHTALVVRMKFTAIPGQQWVLRKEVYRRVQERLRAEGFEFARPVVSVQIEEQKTSAGERSAAAGAAAGQGLTKSPEEKQNGD
jgi:small-conductance mechanosensitive channel